MSSVESWRWAAFQMLLYGSESYARLVAHAPAYSRWKVLDRCVRRIQTRYRSRLLFRFARVSQSIILSRRQQKAEEERQRMDKAARYVQKMYRGKVVTDLFRTLARSAVTADRDAKVTRLRELQEKQEQREERRLMERSARKIQCKSRVVLARQHMASLHRQRQAESADAAVHLSGQAKHVRALEMTLKRHTIVKGVLLEVYSQVCLAYEMESLKRETSEAKAAPWYAELQDALEESIVTQRQLEGKLLALQTRLQPSVVKPADVSGGRGRRRRPRA